MAKVGEGDSRWIVNQRNDGKNVGNWHWSERNCLKIAQDGLRDCLVNAELIPGKCRIVELAKCDGDCYTYNRKGKLYLFSELNLSIKWKCESTHTNLSHLKNLSHYDSIFLPHRLYPVDDGEQEAEGTVDLPNVSDDIESEPLEVSYLCQHI